MDGCVVYLIRHGSTANDEQQYPALLGRNMDLRISHRGLRQIRLLAESLAARNLTTIYTAPSVCAVHTARMIGAGLDDVSIRLRPDLVDTDCGEWAGKSWRQILNEHPDDYNRFVRGQAAGYPGGETLVEAQARMVKAVGECVARHTNKQIAIVSHTQAIQLFLANVAGLTIGRARDIDQDPGCVNVLRYVAGEFLLGATNQPFFIEDLLEALD